MPIFRWKAVDLSFALVIAACCHGSAAAAVGGDWFGPACQYSETSPPLLPAGQRVLLLQAYTSPDESDTVSVLRTAEGEETLTTDPTNLYERALRNFQAAVAGTGAPSATGADGIWSLATGLAVLDSARTGRATKIEIGPDLL